MKTNQLVAASIAFICLGLIAIFKPVPAKQRSMQTIELQGLDADSNPYQLTVYLQGDSTKLKDTLSYVLSQSHLQTDKPDSIIKQCRKVCNGIPISIALSYQKKIN